MQSKTSFFNSALYKKNISRTWIVGLLYFLILLLMLPVSFIISVANFQDSYYVEQGYTKTMMLYEQLRWLPTSEMTFFVAITVAAITFWLLFSKRDTYMLHAFPVTRQGIFFTGVLSSFTVAVAPVVLVSLIMTTIILVEGMGGLGAIWYFALIMTVSTILFLSLSVFALMVSGQLVTGIIFYVIFSFLYILMEIAFRIMAQNLMFGMSQAMNYIDFNVFTPYSFIQENCAVRCIFYMDSNGMVKNFTLSCTGANYLAIYFVASVVIFTVAYLMYKYKKLETVQDFIAVPFMKPVFAVGMSFFISMVAGAYTAAMIDATKRISYSGKFAAAIIAALIFGVIIFFACQMLIEKTVRVFSKKKITQCCVYALASLVVLVALRCDITGAENRVPEANEIQWVGINCDYTMVFTSEDEINTVRSLHKNFLDNKKELRDINYNFKDAPGNCLTIKYKLKNGKTVSRYYDVIDTEYKDITPTYVASTQPILDFLNSPSIIKEHIIGNIWDDCNITDMSFTTYRYDPKSGDYMSEANYFGDLSDREKQAKFKVVYDAFLKDIDEGNVLKTTFGHQDYESNLYDDFNFVVSNKTIPYFSDTDTFDDYNYESYYRYEEEERAMYEQSIYPNLNKKCTNTLNALKAAGFYQDDEVILTYREYNDTLGYNDGDMHLYDERSYEYYN